MSRIGKLFRALGMIAKRPALLNLVLEDNADWRKRVLAKFPHPGGLPRTDITQLIDLPSITVRPFGFLDGGSLPTDLALLKGLAKKFPACDYLEIGTWRGESVANVAEVAKRCVTIDLPADELRAMGKNEQYISMHAFFSKALENVKHIRENTKTLDFNALGKFDLLFVDGDHHYESVKRDTEKIYRLRKNDDSVIVWHDYAYSPESVRWEVLAGILDGLPGMEHKNLYHVSNTLCCIYIKRGLSSSSPLPDQAPSRFFEITITSKPNK